MTRSKLITHFLLVGCVGIGTFNLLIGNAWARGQFSLTCRDVRIGGSILSASCRKIDGQYKHTRINLNPFISNEDGRLRWNNNDFIQSCRRTHLDGANILVAECRRRDQNWVRTRINLDNHIVNRDGNLGDE